MPCTDTSIRLTVSHVDGRHLRPGRRVTDFKEVLVSAAGMLGLVSSVRRKIPGCTQLSVLASCGALRPVVSHWTRAVGV